VRKICGRCKVEFISRGTKRKFCSPTCYVGSLTGVRRSNHSPRGDRNPNWKGGKRLDKDGYVLINSPYHPLASADGYVREHRLVLEKHLFRFLLPEEIVHHENGKKEDNRVENLRLMTKEEHDALPGHFNSRGR